jgi:hypothetical protein
VERLVTYEEFGDRVGMEIPKGDYLCFIRPHENTKCVEEIRASGRRK